MDPKERDERETKRLKGDELVAYHLSALRVAIVDVSDKIQQLSDNTGKWLAAIALAAANPDNNTDEVQKHIDEAASAVKAAREKLQTSVDNQTKGD
jgi:alkylhydroperoxidase/carboxymuconolactone decarboxylase family protein YurZ